jgi:hypothetical protein
VGPNGRVLLLAQFVGGLQQPSDPVVTTMTESFAFWPSCKYIYYMTHRSLSVLPKTSPCVGTRESAAKGREKRGPLLGILFPSSVIAWGCLNSFAMSQGAGVCGEFLGALWACSQWLVAGDDPQSRISLISSLRHSTSSHAVRTSPVLFASTSYSRNIINSRSCHRLWFARRRPGMP